jgi:acyl carrier protein
MLKNPGESLDRAMAAGPAPMTPGRQLLEDLLGDPELVASLADTDLLLTSGINSGDVVRVSLAIEEHLGRPLTSDAAESLRTIADIDAVLAGERTG